MGITWFREQATQFSLRDSFLLLPQACVDGENYGSAYRYKKWGAFERDYTKRVPLVLLNRTMISNFADEAQVRFDTVAWHTWSFVLHALCVALPVTPIDNILIDKPARVFPTVIYGNVACAH